MIKALLSLVSWCLRLLFRLQTVDVTAHMFYTCKAFLRQSTTISAICSTRFADTTHCVISLYWQDSRLSWIFDFAGALVVSRFADEE